MIVSMLNLSQIWPVKETSSSCDLWICPHHSVNISGFLAQNVPGSSCPFPAPALELAIRQGATGALTFPILCSSLPGSLSLPLVMIPSLWSLPLFILHDCSHDFWIWLSIPISSSNRQTCTCNCLLDFSNPMSHGHFKLSELKLTYPSPPNLPFPDSLLLLMASLSKKNPTVILTLVFSPTPCTRTVSQCFSFTSVSQVISPFLSPSPLPSLVWITAEPPTRSVCLKSLPCLAYPQQFF